MQKGRASLTLWGVHGDDDSAVWVLLTARSIVAILEVECTLSAELSTSVKLDIRRWLLLLLLLVGCLLGRGLLRCSFLSGGFLLEKDILSQYLYTMKPASDDRLAHSSHLGCFLLLRFGQSPCFEGGFLLLNIVMVFNIVILQIFNGAESLGDILSLGNGDFGCDRYRCGSSGNKADKRQSGEGEASGSAHDVR